MVDSLILGIQRRLDSQLEVPVDNLRRKIEALERMIDSGNRLEDRFQEWFEKNPDFLMMGGDFAMPNHIRSLDGRIKIRSNPTSF